MKTLIVSMLAIGFSTAAFAQAATDFATVDADASGEVSYTEAVVAWPDLTEDQFKAADADASTGLNAEEYAALSSAAGGAAPTDPAAAPAAPVAPAQ